MEPKTIRNMRIVRLKDKKKMSFGEIAEKEGITKQTAHEIYWRVKKRQDLSTVNA